jgi:hypothetical protein
MIRVGFGECVLAKTSDGGATTPTSLSFSIDNEGYSSHLGTDPNFGCVQHEAQ